jgi:hypothetical protein
VSQTLRATACHEAGHAVIATAAGYDVADVQVWEVSSSDPKGKWEGHTNYLPGSFVCPECNARASDIHDPDLIGCLTDGCAPCEVERQRFARRLLAGGAATVHLEPNDHDPYLMGDDNEKLFRAYPNSDRIAIYSSTEKAATKAVQETEHAIAEVRDLLIQRAETAPCFEVVCVSGSEIREIIQKHCTSPSEEEGKAPETNVQLPM